MTTKATLLFISPRFLFPTDSGGKIRTTQVLRGLKGGDFRIRLLMPGSEQLNAKYRESISSVCDESVHWPIRHRSRFAKLLAGAAHLFSAPPIPVMSDLDRRAKRLVAEELAAGPELVVFDFPHSAILAPATVECPSLVFAHNVEAEIFERHVQVARSPLSKWLWRSQHRKMLKFEGQTLRRFDSVVAVSERDCAFFRSEYRVEHCAAIPTGVDTEFFRYADPTSEKQVVFCGSMDWMANIDAIEYFHGQIWPSVLRQAPGARMKIIGKNPPESLVRAITSRSPEWEFTGFVDDVRDHVCGAAAFVIPLRVGGGTRIKAFEAMSMGCPVVSTSIGVEGLPVEHGVHYLCADDEAAFSDSVAALLNQGERRRTIASAARALVDERFGFRNAAAAFGNACQRTLQRRLG